jgi:exosortase
MATQGKISPNASLTSNLSTYAAIALGVCIVGAFARTLVGIGGSWFDEPSNMEHGPFVPIIVAYMVWLKREQLRLLPKRPSPWGIAIVAAAGALSVLSAAAQWTWVSRMAFLASFVGCIVALYGFRIVRELVYPLCTLMLMIALPTFVIERITIELQLLASRLGEISLELFGFSVLREGNVLEMVGEKLAVAEACSGIRSLMALIFLAAVYNYFFVPRNAVRLVIFGAVVPVAILCNAGRILATGVVGQYNRELAHGMLHATFGYLSLTLGAALLILLHRLLIRIRIGGLHGV